MDEHFSSKLTEIVLLHDDLSISLKLVKNVIDDFDTTTLNDIRYALRGLVDCVKAAIDDNKDNFDQAFGITITALKIAWHDVVDITIVEFKLYLEAVSTKYDLDIVASILPLSDCKNCIYRIEDLIIESRGDRNRRIELYRQINSKELVNVLNLYRKCRDLEAAIATKQKKEKSSKFITKAGLTLAICSVAILSYVNFFKKDNANLHPIEINKSESSSIKSFNRN